MRFFPGDPRVPRTLAPTRYNVAPRIGLAYSPKVSGGWLGKLLGGPGKTSIRAVYGIYYTAEEGLGLFSGVGDAPFYSSPSPPLLEEPSWTVPMVFRKGSAIRLTIRRLATRTSTSRYSSPSRDRPGTRQERGALCRAFQFHIATSDWRQHGFLALRMSEPRGIIWFRPSKGIRAIQPSA